MHKKSPVPAYRLLSKPSNKLKLFINHYESPCIIKSEALWFNIQTL